jgi:hypothetical protein
VGSQIYHVTKNDLILLAKIAPPFSVDKAGERSLDAKNNK